MDIHAATGVILLFFILRRKRHMLDIQNCSRRPKQNTDRLGLSTAAVRLPVSVYSAQTSDDLKTAIKCRMGVVFTLLKRNP